MCPRSQHTLPFMLTSLALEVNLLLSRSLLIGLEYMIRDKKQKKKTAFAISFSVTVGMTRLELATSRPPDVCATNCATSRC